MTSAVWTARIRSTASFAAVKWLKRSQQTPGRSTGRRRRAAIGLLLVLFVVGAASAAVAQRGERFSDVPADHPDRTAIEWAAEVGLTVGLGDGRFGPDEAMTRFQALTFMERFFELGLADGFSRGDMMTLLHAINRDLPLLNRSRCADSNATGTVGPFLLLEGHHGVEFRIVEPDGSKYKGRLWVHITGLERSRLFPHVSYADREQAQRSGEWFTVHKASETEWVSVEVLTDEPARWELCVTARRLEKIGL